jgi:hypothetical protein
LLKTIQKHKTPAHVSRCLSLAPLLWKGAAITHVKGLLMVERVKA